MICIFDDARQKWSTDKRRDKSWFANEMSLDSETVGHCPDNSTWNMVCNIDPLLTL